YLGEPGEILSQYSQLTGRAGQPPLWSLGPWLRQAPDASVEQLAADAAALREAGFPVETVAVDGPAAWEVRGKQPFEWDTSRLPDAKGWLAQCREANLRVCAPGF